MSVLREIQRQCKNRFKKWSPKVKKSDRMKNGKLLEPRLDLFSDLKINSSMSRKIFNLFFKT
jgi:hypothetical protein